MNPRFLALVLALAPASAAALTLTSPDVRPGARLDDVHALSRNGCPGENLSPALSWTGAPRATQSFAVTLFDLDAGNGRGFWHWVLVDIPLLDQDLPRGAGAPGANPAGSTVAANDFGAPGYGGPCPPLGDLPHHYRFTVYALDVRHLELDAKQTAAQAAALIDSHTLAEASLTATWGR